VLSTSIWAFVSELYVVIRSGQGNRNETGQAGPDDTEVGVIRVKWSP